MECRNGSYNFPPDARDETPENSDDLEYKDRSIFCLQPCFLIKNPFFVKENAQLAHGLHGRCAAPAVVRESE